MHKRHRRQKSKIVPIGRGNNLKKICILLGIILFISVLIVYARLENNKHTFEPPNGSLLPETTNCTIQRVIPYAQDGNPYHLMDVYMPEGEGPFPALVYVHGGSWVDGQRDGCDTTGEFYARRGIAGFSIDYTLATKNSSSWPQAIQDVILAIRHIKENSARYQIDPERVAVMGESAGGHLVSLAGTLSGNESFLAGASGNPEISSRVCLVADYFGPTDFQFIGETGPSFSPYSLIETFLGETYAVNQSRWIEASPATYITADDPIFVIVHGTNDFTVPIAVSESFESKLDLACVETYFVRVKGGGHGFSHNEITTIRYTLEPLLKQVFDLK